MITADAPEAVEKVMQDNGLKLLHNIAADGPFFIYGDTVDAMDDSLFERYMKFHFQMCEVKSLLGYSAHGLYVGQKPI